MGPHPEPRTWLLQQTQKIVARSVPSVATMHINRFMWPPVLAKGREFVAEVSVSSSCTREKGYLHCEKQSFAS